MPQTAGAWRDRTRASIAWAMIPAMAGLWLVSVIQQHSFPNSIGASGTHGPLLSTGGHVAADAMTGIRWAGLAALVLLLAGWATVWGFADRVPKGRPRRRWFMLALAPLVAGVAEIGLQFLRDKFAPLVFSRNAERVVHGHVFIWFYSYSSGGHPLAATVASIAWDTVAVAGVLSVLGVVLAARRANLQVSDLRGGVRLAQLTAIVMVIAALASVAWGIGVTHQPTIPIAALTGVAPTTHPWTGIETSIAAEWPLISASLMAVAMVTTWAAMTARRSYRAARALVVSAG